MDQNVSEEPHHRTIHKLSSMDKTEPADVLKELIRLKEAEQQREEQLLKEHFHSTAERLQPINLLRSAAVQLSASPKIKAELTGAVVGIVSNYLLKKVLPVQAPSDFMNMVSSIAGLFTKRKAAQNSTEEVQGAQL